MNPPLAEQLRPQKLEDYIGQDHIMGLGKVLRVAIETKNLPSMILWGPPGVGKTTLANLIAKELDREFFTLSAVDSGVKQVREVLNSIEGSLLGETPILFIDEIHRFSKSQQDSLLSAIEKGQICFIGATTENPSFEIIRPLISRCQVYVLKELSSANLNSLLERSCLFLKEKQGLNIVLQETEALQRISGGDGRKLLNALELSVSLVSPNKDGEIVLDNKVVTELIQKNLAFYDKKGENHYDIISAFIKSIRGSDPNAAVYYLARMLSGGEDILFIARRMLILASEDIGNANPNALLLANACFDTVNKIGMPEARIPLSQTAIYLACSPKSNASYLAINSALEEVSRSGDLSVPLQIRNAPTSLMKDLGYSKGYQYAHDCAGNFANMEFLPQELSGKKFFSPQENAREKEMQQRLRSLWKEKYGY